MKDNGRSDHAFQIMPLLERIKAWAQRLKREIITLYFVCRHPGTPWPVKALGLIVVAYALSPIDLIPDFIPVLGFLDDAILLPGLLWIGVRATPGEILAECRAKALERDAGRARLPKSYLGAATVLVVWTASAYALWWWLQQ